MNASDLFPKSTITPAVPVTPRAFAAIVRQFANQGYYETQAYAVLDGDQLEWTAFFETDADPYAGMNERHEVCSYTRCKLVGAWAENGETEQLYAGSRAEVAAMIGDAAVARWEVSAEVGANE